MLRFDLLPFLQLRFGRLLDPFLESVTLVQDDAGDHYLNCQRTTQGGGTRTEQVPVVLAHREGAPFPEIVFEHLSCDAYDWANIAGGIFTSEAHAVIARRAAAGGFPSLHGAIAQDLAEYFIAHEDVADPAAAPRLREKGYLVAGHLTRHNARMTLFSICDEDTALLLTALTPPS